MQPAKKQRDGYVMPLQERLSYLDKLLIQEVVHHSYRMVLVSWSQANNRVGADGQKPLVLSSALFAAAQFSR